jgi:hypothetical protein
MRRSKKMSTVRVAQCFSAALDDLQKLPASAAEVRHHRCVVLRIGSRPNPLQHELAAESPRCTAAESYFINCLNRSAEAMHHP